jgi:hypothetical protein
MQGFQPSFAQWAGNCELTTDVRNTFPGSVKLRAGSGALRAPYSGQSFGGLGDVVARAAQWSAAPPRTS